MRSAEWGGDEARGSGGHETRTLPASSPFFSLPPVLFRIPHSAIRTPEMWRRARFTDKLDMNNSGTRARGRFSLTAGVRTETGSATRVARVAAGRPRGRRTPSDWTPSYLTGDFDRIHRGRSGRNTRQKRRDASRLARWRAAPSPAAQMMSRTPVPSLPRSRPARRRRFVRIDTHPPGQAPPRGRPGRDYLDESLDSQPLDARPRAPRECLTTFQTTRNAPTDTSPRPSPFLLNDPKRRNYGRRNPDPRRPGGARRRGA